PDRALDFRVTGMADQYQDPATRNVALTLDVHLGDQRTGGVEYRQAAGLCLIDDRLRHTVGTEDRHCPVRNLIEVLDEDCSLALESLDHMPIVDNLMTHIDWRAELLQRAADNVDCPHDTRAKAPRLSQKNPHPDHSFRRQSWSDHA